MNYHKIFHITPRENLRFCFYQLFRRRLKGFVGFGLVGALVCYLYCASALSGGKLLLAMAGGFAAVFAGGVLLTYLTARRKVRNLDYQQELAKCQAYLLVLNQAKNSWESFGVGDANTTGRAFIMIPTPVPMRTTPTITIGSNITLRNGPTYPQITSASVYRRLENSICLDIRSTGLVAGAIYSLTGNTNTADNQLIFSAEL